MNTFLRFLLTLVCLVMLAHTAALAQTKRKPTARPITKPVPKPASPPVTRTVPPPVPAPARVPAPAPAASPTPVRTTSAEAFGVGTNALNLGIGLGNRYGYGTGFSSGSSSVSPAISLSFERGIIPLGPGVLGVGVFAGYQGASYDLGGGDKWTYTDIIVMVRGAFHYPVSDKFDAYGGAGLGLRHVGVSFTGNSLYQLGAVSSNDLASGLFVGGRYFFVEKIGAFAELGYDQTYLKIGLTAKF